MPAVSSQNRSKFHSRCLTAGLSLILLGSLSLTFGGCDWFKPTPDDTDRLGKTTQADNDVVAVYFSKYQGSKSIVENVSRQLPEEAKAEPLKFALIELLKGPSVEEKSQGFYTEIPKGTKLLGVDKDQKIVTIDLSSQFSGGGGATSMTQRLEELKRTVKAVDAKSEVNVAVDGKPLEVLGGEGLEVPGTMQSGPQ